MNIHHLELFYYVARHGGIMEAVRNMPYGIQQPAMSSQILQLEEELGVKLFQRRPFELSPAGQELYAFVRPFFGSVDQVGERLRGGVAQSLRLAAPVMALRDHLPAVLQDLRRRFPKLRLTLRAGQQPQVWSWLERHELDLAITLLEDKSPPGLNQVPLIDLPIVLLVSKACRFRSADDAFRVLSDGNPPEPLITLTPGELAPRRLREHLAGKGLEWQPDIEVTDLELIDTYVARGFGIGLTLDVPGKSFPKGTRRLPIPGLAPLQLGAAWHGKPTVIMQELLLALRGQVSAVLGT